MQRRNRTLAKFDSYARTGEITTIAGVVDELELWWPEFNRKPLGPDDVLIKIDSYGISAIPDDCQLTATALTEIGTARRYIFYNPKLPDGEQALHLGHEFGHYLFGDMLAARHVKNPRLPILEWGAMVIGHLCLIPTPMITQLHTVIEELNPDNLLWHLSPLGVSLEREMGICRQGLRSTGTIWPCSLKRRTGSFYKSSRL